MTRVKIMNGEQLPEPGSIDLLVIPHTEHGISYRYRWHINPGGNLQHGSVSIQTGIMMAASPEPFPTVFIQTGLYVTADSI